MISKNLMVNRYGIVSLNIPLHVKAQNILREILKRDRKLEEQNKSDINLIIHSKIN